ncbi:uncharacterized protein LOC135150307 [Daucus carota subsp. sativus]|uniref:uncharacterized protein LOC135150307 n=1 Tax=Daucus carota subsp. sativus TaxID=79200 RepID=UPI003082B97B
MVDKKTTKKQHGNRLLQGLNYVAVDSKPLPYDTFAITLVVAIFKINTALRLDGSEAEDVEVPKNPSEFTEEDEKEVHKDNKAMNILFNGIDDDMFDSVINCPTAKEVWDTIQTLCEGTDQVRENKMQLFVQQYESFHSKSELEKNSKREKTVALVAEKEEEEEKTLKSVIAGKTSSSSACDGKKDDGKKKGKVIEEDEEPSAQDELDDLDEHLAFLARKFSKLKFKRNAVSSRPFNRGNQSKSSGMVDRSKFKCFNCGLPGHFSNECRRPSAEKKGSSSENVDYRRKYFDLFKQSKEKAFITEDGDWAADEGDSDTEEHVNLALMAIGDDADYSTTSNGQVKITNTADLTKSECKQIIDDMSNEIYNLRVSLKSLTKENVRIKGTNDLLAEKNGKLETELIQMDKFKKASELAKDELLAVLKREEILKKQLEREQEIIAKWKDSRNVLENMCSTQVLEETCKSAWRKNKKMLDEFDLLVDSDHPLIDSQSMDESYPSKNQTAVDENKLKKLDKKYGPINKNFVKESGSSKKIEKEGIGHGEEKMEVGKGKKKSSRNGKVGINKKNDYTPDKHAVRKTCSKCGSVNHLAVNCKNALFDHCMSNSMMNSHMSYMPMFPPTSIQYANMPFMPNPFFNAFNMSAMPNYHDSMNHAYTNQFSVNSTNVGSSNSAVMPKVKKINSEDEVVSKPSKSKENNSSKPKGGRKNLWYLDSGCSRHMTGDSTLLSNFEERAGPSITFGDDSKGFTLGYGIISKGNVIIDNVALVKGLKHNLLSISQLCDRGHQVWFSTEACVISDKKDNKVVLTGNRKGNVYIADFNSTSADSLTCLFSKASLDESWLWHKKLSHLNFKAMNDLVRKDLVRGLPKLEFSKDGLCDACQIGKQRKSSFKSKLKSSIDRPLQLLHMDLFGPVNIMSISKKKYCLVIVDDFTRFTWTYFLHSKDEASEIIINHIKIVDNIDPGRKVSRIRSDNGTEFKNSEEVKPSTTDYQRTTN